MEHAWSVLENRLGLSSTSEQTLRAELAKKDETIARKDEALTEQAEALAQKDKELARLRDLLGARAEEGVPPDA